MNFQLQSNMVTKCSTTSCFDNMLLSGIHKAVMLKYRFCKKRMHNLDHLIGKKSFDIHLFLEELTFLKNNFY